LKYGKKTWVKNKEIVVQNISLSLIDPSPYQPRQQFSPTALTELSLSIKENGLLQPIAVRPVGNRYQLIAGERRLKASRLAGMDTIDSIVVNVENEQAALLCMVENLQREQLHFFEEAEGYQTLISMHNMTQHDLARKLGKQQSTIANKLRLLRLNDILRAKIIRNKLTERHARALLKLPNEQDKLQALDVIIKNSLNVAESESLIEKMLIPKEPKKKQNLTRLYSDWRFANNSIKQIVKKMRKGGCDVSYNACDLGDRMEITVSFGKVKKRSIQAN
jgi:ParB family chromosome partitioning protein